LINNKYLPNPRYWDPELQKKALRLEGLNVLAMEG
jgi:hypothetical protein